jgi:galactose mutarotase-like enzyme
VRSGWRELPLENEELRVVVLPDRGAEIVELLHRPSGVDPLFHAPWGLAPPDSPARDGSDGHAFLEVYAGGWQELFPSVNDPCTYRGHPIPFHGEVATLPWDCERDGDSLRCSVHCRETPFLLERVMRLEDASLSLEERVRNEGDEPAHLVWGHHCVVGPPFLEPGCRLHVPARTIETIPEMWEDTARLEPGQREPWPEARLRRGGTADLTVVPGPEEESHDDVYLTDLVGGWAAVENPRLGLAFRLEWDPAVFRWVISWQAYGGARAMPLAGSYALGVEPWVTRLNLEQAVEAGEAIELDPGAEFATTLRAEIQESTR